MSLHPFRLREASLPLVLACCTGFGLLQPGTRADAAELTGSAALTTDYVFRGISQTQGDPAAQMGAKLAGESGLYSAVWGSTVEFSGDSGASSEVDYVVGWGGKVSTDWALDINATYFDYPSARVDLSYPELIGTVAYRDNYGLTVGYSPDVFASGERGIYLQLAARFQAGDRVRIEAAAGHYRLDDAYGSSYIHAQLGAVWIAEAPFELRITAHSTNSEATRLFPELAGSRIEAALQSSF